MDAFEWVDSLSSDIDKVDNQHKQLFSIMNAYFAAMSKAEASVILMESV